MVTKTISSTDKTRSVIFLASVLLFTFASMLTGCGSGGDGDGAGRGGEDRGGQTGPNGQIERLGRPAINEGLIISNDLLNAFNMVPPSADLSDAAAPVRDEAAKSIMAFDMIDGKQDITVEAVVGAFLPDVMRIDTRLDIPPGSTAYNAATSGDKGMLIGGRKLQDDVIDITLSFLVAGDPSGNSVKDNVSFGGVRGNANQPSKRPISSQFPFVGRPYGADVAVTPDRADGASVNNAGAETTDTREPASAPTSNADTSQ